MARLFRSDGWTSLINGLGNSDYDKRMSVTFGEICSLDDRTINNLWRGNALAKKAIEKLPEHEMRAGFDIEIKEDDSAEGGEDEKPKPYRGDAVAVPEGKPDPQIVEAKEIGSEKRAARSRSAEDAADRIEQVREQWKSLEAIEKIQEARNQQRARGLSAILLGTKDNVSMDKPLDIERVRSLDFLTLLEKQELHPLYTYGDLSKPNYGKVSHWAIFPMTLGPTPPGVRMVIPRYTLVHESRLLVFQGPIVSRLVQPGMHPGAGDSVLQPLYETLRDSGIGWSSAAVLMADFSQAWLKIKSLSAMLGADDPEHGVDAFVDRMRLHERARSVARLNIIDSEEEFGRSTTPVTGLAELLEIFMVRVAADMDMPVTEVWGTSAKGLNATGEGDRVSWHATIGASRTKHVIPPLEMITRCILAATGRMPKRWCVKGKELAPKTDKEKAEIEKLEAEADHIRVEDQIVSPEEVAVSRFKDGSRGLKVDFDAREELEAASAKPVLTEGKDPDLEPKVIGPNGEEVPAGATIMDPPKPEQKPQPKR